MKPLIKNKVYLMGDDIQIPNDSFSNSSSDYILLNILKHEFQLIVIDRHKMIMEYHFVHITQLEWALYCQMKGILFELCIINLTNTPKIPILLSINVLCSASKI